MQGEDNTKMRVKRPPGCKRSTVSCVALCIFLAASLVDSAQAAYSCTSDSHCGATTSRVCRRTPTASTANGRYFTALSLIPINNPWFLFWVSLASLLCSVAASFVLSFRSRINLPWITRAFIVFPFRHSRRFWAGSARKMEFKSIVVC